MSSDTSEASDNNKVVHLKKSCDAEISVDRKSLDYVLANIPFDLTPIFPPHEQTHVMNGPNGPYGLKISNSSGRLWEAPLKFINNDVLHYTLKVENVQIPVCEVNLLDEDILCASLPETLNKILLESSKKYYPLNTHSMRYYGDSLKSRAVANTMNLNGKPGEWWRFIEKKGPLGVFDNTTRAFEAVKLPSLLKETRSGIKATLILRFFLQALSEEWDGEVESMRLLRIEMVKGYLISIDPRITPPFQEISGCQMPTERDLPSNSLTNILKNLKV